MYPICLLWESYMSFVEIRLWRYRVLWRSPGRVLYVFCGGRSTRVSPQKTYKTLTGLSDGCTANPNWDDIFESLKLKARTSLLPHFIGKRHSSFELWALKQHSKMSPQVGSAASYMSFVRVLYLFCEDTLVKIHPSESPVSPQKRHRTLLRVCHLCHVRSVLSPKSPIYLQKSHINLSKSHIPALCLCR